MSVPKKDTTWGEVLYEGKKYGILNGFHLSEEIWGKYEHYTGDKGCALSTAPWATIKVFWSIENNRLYLTRFCSDGLLTELMGSEKILADWVEELSLSEEHRKVCKTYEQKNSYLNEMKILHLTLEKGVIVNMERETERYTSREMREYMDRNPAYVTLRIDSIDLLIYLENEVDQPNEDQLFPILSNLIDPMLQEGGESDISLGMIDLTNTLKEGSLAVFGSAKGSDTDEMMGSLMDSMTDEILDVKGCLMHITMHKSYPVQSVEKIVNRVEKQLSKYGKDPLTIYAGEKPFYFGTLSNEKMAEDEILIRMLVCI